MQRRGVQRWIGASLLVAGLMHLGANALMAGSGRVTVSNSKGLTLSVDSQWIDSGGYRPTRITLTPAAAAAADRSFHVEFHATTYYSNRSIVVSQDFDLPAGSLSATTTLRVPQYFPWQNYDLEIWEDGRYLKGLSQQRTTVTGGQDWAEGLPGVLIVLDKSATPPVVPAVPPGMTSAMITAAPDLRTATLASLLPNPEVQSGMRVATVQGGAATHLDSSIALPINELPQNWLDYSGLDIVCISLAQAKLMAAEEAARWNALRAWVVAGGNLLVSGVASDAPQLAELERLLNEPGRKIDEADPAKRGWTKPTPESFKAELRSPFGATKLGTASATNGMAAGMPGGPAIAVPAPAPQPQPQTPPAPVHDPPFVLRKHGLGLVVAVAADDLFAQQADQWLGLLNNIGLDRWVWYRRHGVSPQRENRDFWNWPIPGVGLAPVTAFQVLITGFVIAIGPLNYWWLRRRGKLHLLVLVVPLSAAFVTLALFSYALAVDGFGVRVRTRSFTLLDQRTGEASCWARISYYAGLAPAGGLKFPDDVAAIALLPQTPDDRYGELRRRTLSWSPGEQDLVNGWIPSRTPTQFLTVRSRRSVAGLHLKKAVAGSPRQIENHLGVGIERLLLADAEGKHYVARTIPLDGAATLEPADLVAESAAFRDLYNQRRPAVPQGFGRAASGFVSANRFRWTSPLNNSLPAAALQTSLLERELEAAMFHFGQMQGANPTGLKPRTYVAIVERSPEVEYGVASSEEEQSLHVVAGRW